MDEEQKAAEQPSFRIFASRIKGSAFVFGNGRIVHFVNGWYETSDPMEIAELDAVAGKVPTVFRPEQEEQLIAMMVEARAKGETLGDYASIVNRVIEVQLPKQANLNLPTDGLQPALATDTEATLKAALKANQAGVSFSGLPRLAGK